MKQEVIGHLEEAEVLTTLTNPDDSGDIARMARQGTSNKQRSENSHTVDNKPIPPHVQSLYEKSIIDRLNSKTTNFAIK